MNRIARHFPHRLRKSVLAAAIAYCFMPSATLANPTGATVVHGQVGFSRQGNTLTITNSPSSIINWQSFSIGVGETTRFVQQNAASAVLNRVVGVDPSTILGTLQSNGRVFLINPNGILFGAGAVVDVAGLVASTLNITNADFLAGRMRFDAGTGAKSVNNAGEIVTPSGGQVLLIAPEGVENSGIIRSPKGEVILAAGKTVELADSTNPEVRVEVSAPEAKAINLGRIVAESGRIGIYGGIVANRGHVSANSAVVGENGRIVFRATKDATLEAGSVTTAGGASGGEIEVRSGSGATLVSGAVAATGAAGAGGDVRLLGERVGVLDGAKVDASGATGGGTILVGGDYQGTNPAVPNAQFTYVGAGAELKADAGANGDGGRVIVWADDTTRSHGSISARGGAQGGNGGLVETSGKRHLQVTKGPDVRAPRGQPGTWVLDPIDIEIVAGNEATENSAAPFFSPIAESSRIGVDLINAQLDFGSNVLINTTNQGPGDGAQAGNITLSAPIVKSAATTEGGPFIGTTSLTLQAHNDIVITPAGSITSTGDRLNVNLVANWDNQGAGAVTVGGTIVTNGGSFSASGSSGVALNAPVNTLNPLEVGGGGSVSLSSNAGTVAIAAGVTAGSGIFLTGQNGVSVAAPMAGTSLLATSAAGQVTIAGNVATSGNVALTGAGVRVAGGNTISTEFGSFSATDTAATTLIIEPGAAVTSSGATLTSNRMQIGGTLNARNGAVTLRQNTNGTGIFLGADTGGGLTITQNTLNNITTNGGVFVGNTQSGPVVINAPISLGGTILQFVLNSGSTITQNAGAAFAANVTVSMSASGDITLNAPFSAPGVSLSSNGAFVQNAGAPLTSNNFLTISAPAGITLGAAVSGTYLTFTGNLFAPNAGVSSTSDIDIRTSSFGRPINLGVTTPGMTAMDLTGAQLNNLAAPDGVVRIGTTSSGAITIAGPIAPSGTPTLALTSGGNITQDAGATITIPNLLVRTSTNNAAIHLPEANNVGTLAANLSGPAGNFTFANAAAAPLTIGTVDGWQGISNFTSTTTKTAMVSADNLTLAQPISYSGGTVTVRPTTETHLVDLGGADAAGVLGLNSTDVGNVFANTFMIRANRANITAPITSSSGTLAIAPITPTRPLHVVSSAKDAMRLDFTPDEFANVTANGFQLGDATTGPLTVETAINVPGTITTFGLHSGDGNLGLTINGAINAANHVSLTADLMQLNQTVSSSTGDIGVFTSTTGREIHLGDRNGNWLGLTRTEIENRLLPADAAKLTFGNAASGNVTVTDQINLTNPGLVLTIASGGTITSQVEAPIAAPSLITLEAANLTLNDSVVSNQVILIADRMTINSNVESTGGGIRVWPRTLRSITVGTDTVPTSLGLTTTSLNNLVADGFLQIGDHLTTQNIQITAPIAPAGTSTLDLIAGFGSLSQVSNATIQVENLSAQANGAITLGENNNLLNVALRNNFGNITLTDSPASPLVVGTVNNISGINAQGFNNTVTIRADALTIDQPITASNRVIIAPNSIGQEIDLGSKPVGKLGLTNAELGRVSTPTLALGSTSTGNTTVSAPVTLNDVNLELTTGPSASTTVNADLTVNGGFNALGNITISTPVLTVAAPLTSSSGNVTVAADNMTFTAGVSAPNGSMLLQPLTAGTLIAVGGMDDMSVPAILGLDATDLGNLTYGPNSLTIGNLNSGNMTVSHAGMLPGTVSLITGGNMTVTASTFSVEGDLNLRANTLDIPGVAGLAAGGNVRIEPASGGRAVNFVGKPGTGTTLELDPLELNKISAPGTLTIDTSGTMTTGVPVTLTSVPNVILSAGTLNHGGGVLSASGDITLRANTMTVGSGVTSSGGGRITVARRTNGSMNLGNTAGGVLGLTPDAMAQFSTEGVIQYGESGNTTGISVTQPITQLAGSEALALVSGFSGISQTAGSTITASNLRVQSNGAVTLNQTNNVGTLAGSSSGSFSFSSAGTLTIGTVDGVSGITDGTITLLAGDLNILQPISGGNTTLAPFTAGAPITLGSAAGGFSLTNTEIGLVSATNLAIGTTTNGGSIVVTSPIARAFGNLALTIVPGGNINVNAALGSSDMSNLTLNAGVGGGVSVTAAMRASGQINVTGGTIAVNAPVTSEFSNITLQAPAGSTGSSTTVGGEVKARFGVTITSDTILINAPVISEFSGVTLQGLFGGSGGDVTVNQQITAGSFISIIADRLALNAPLVTTGSSVYVAPRSPGVNITLGQETPNTLSLSSEELARILTEYLEIGSSNSGDIVVNAPIGPFTFYELALYSGGSISQTPGSTITLRTLLDPADPSSAFGGLEVYASGSVLLPERNDIATYLFGQASGPGSVFQFDNIGPIRLQDTSGNSGVQNFAPLGKALFNLGAARFVPPPPIVPPPVEPSPPMDTITPTIEALNKAAETQEKSDEETRARDENREKEEKKDDEKAGRQSCA